MKVRVRSVVACLVLIAFANCHAVACVTAETDLSGGGWETSAGADPCSSVQTSHGALLSSRQPSGTNVAAAHKYLSLWTGWAPYTGRNILAILVILLVANRPEIITITQDAQGIGSNASGTQVNV